ncbi:MAG: alpha-mannosidase [Ruminococcaceae bacterium]|nr:alpha-mannosidase [Oscillospiraceae bacterium]
MFNEAQLRRTFEKIVRLEEQLAGRMFRKVGELSAVELFETEEHLYRIPTEGYRPIEKGELWGDEKRLGWFRGHFTVPQELDGQELFMQPQLNGEMLYYVNGVEMGIFTKQCHLARQNAKHWCNRLCAKATAGETLDVVIESWCGRYIPNSHPFGAGELWHGSFRTAYDGVDICIKDDLCYDLYFDLHVVTGLVRDGRVDHFRRMEVLRTLEDAHEEIYYHADFVDEETFRAGLRALHARIRPILASHGADTPSRPVIGVIGHSHIDTAWLWTTEDTIKKAARTFSNQLNLMERYPEHRFVQSSAYHCEMMRRHYPDLFERIAARVREGRWEPNGGVWVECDCNITGGESMVRQFLWGQRYTRRHFGYTSNCFWLPDTFGYSASIPQIMKGCGVDYFLTTKMGWNDTNAFPYDAFYWQGLDGTRVFTHLNTIGAGNMEPKLLNDIAGGIRQRASTHRRLHAYGPGDGGGGPQFEMLEGLRRMADLDGCPKTEYTTVGAFMKTLESEAVEPPLYAKELYLELHRGTLTNQHEIKRNNRKAEQALHDVEFLMVAEAVRNGVPASGEKVTPIWETVLLNQFHDILPGTCIEAAHVACKEQMRAARAALRELCGTTLTTAKETAAVTAVNTLSFPREDVWYATLPAGKHLKGAVCQTFTDFEGNVRTAVGGTVLPPLSATAFELTAAKESASVFRYDGDTLTTPFATMTFDERGAIASFVDTRTGRELCAGQPLNTFLFGEDVPLAWENWDVDADLFRKLKPCATLLSREVVSAGAVELRLRSHYRISEKTDILQDMVVYAASPLVRFDTKICWRDDHRFLKAAFDTNVLAPQARFEMQFGHVQRSTNHSTSEEIAQFEVACHKYTDLSDTRYGVAVLNDCKYGVSVEGGCIGLSLHKGGTAPDASGDHGEHFCTYAFLPHASGFSVPAVAQPAYALNYPPVIIEGRCDLPAMVTVETDNVLIETVKPCEDAENAYILRLYEAEGGSAATRLQFAVPPRAVYRTNMLEEVIEEIDPQNVPLTFSPFHIETLKVVY